MKYKVVSKINASMSETGSRVGCFRDTIFWATPYKSLEEAEKALAHLNEHQSLHKHWIESLEEGKFVVSNEIAGFDRENEL